MTAHGLKTPSFVQLTEFPYLIFELFSLALRYMANVSHPKFISHIKNSCLSKFKTFSALLISYVFICNFSLPANIFKIVFVVPELFNVPGSLILEYLFDRFVERMVLFQLSLYVYFLFLFLFLFSINNFNIIMMRSTGHFFCWLYYFAKTLSLS